MKLTRFNHKGTVNYGRLEEDRIHELKTGGKDIMPDSFLETGREYSLEEVRLTAPCMPSKVICLGLNYRSHAEEMNFPLPKVPIIFLKPSTAVIGPQEPIIYPPQSRRVDYEAELGAVIGKKAFKVPPDLALDYVLGYTCANDVTARDKQPAHGQWTYAKGFDTFCPLGPVIETGIEDPEALAIEGLLNGKKVQASNTSDHIFSVAKIISFVSACMTLLPGDVILTGTCSGIGPMKPGDIFTVKIATIGELSNPVKEES